MDNANDSFNAQVEREKLTLEHEKTRIARNSFRVDVVARLVVPLVAAALALYGVLHSKDEARPLVPEANTKLPIPLDSPSSAVSESARPILDAEHNKLPFIQNNLAVITSGTDQEIASLKSNAATRFTRSDDLREIMTMIDNLRQNAATRRAQVDTQSVEMNFQSEARAATTPRTEAAHTTSVTLDYAVEAHKELVAGDFEQAATHYLLATKSSPSDSSLWNSLAYAQLRSGQPGDAYSSITRAAALHPTDPKIQNYVAINATKILCALGHKREGLGYLNESLNQLPTLHDRVAGDTEVNRYCD